MLEGYIPDKVVYVHAAPHRVRFTWDQDVAKAEPEPAQKPSEKERRNIHRDGPLDGVEVIPTFVVSGESKQALDNAVSALSGDNSYAEYDNVEKAFGETKNYPVKQIVRKNDPFSGLKVVELDYYAKGGRAIKVVSQGYYFDLREDVFLETIINSGSKKGGYLKGNFVWAVVHNRFKLVRQGSDLYQRLITCTKIRNKGVISPKTLVPGGVYESASGYKGIFLGHCRTAAMSFINRRMSAKNTKAMLFFDYNYGEIEDAHKKIALSLESKHTYELRCFNIKQSHSYIRKIGDAKLPDKLFESIRDASKKALNEDLKEHQDRLKNRSHWDRNYNPADDDSRSYVRWGPLCNISALDEVLEFPEEFKQYLSTTTA